MPTPPQAGRSHPRGCVMRRREKPPAEKQKTNIGGLVSAINPAGGFNTNPSRYPPLSLQAIIATRKTNTRAGDSLSNPTRQSCRAGRIEKITALTKLRHSSTRELHMLHTSGHFL